MAVVIRYRFTVSGHYVFPWDMLRYDSCWPEKQDDAAAIGSTTTRVSRGDIAVGMFGLREPTVERWASFGWTVGEVTKVRI